MLTSKSPGYFHHYIHGTSVVVRKIIPYSSNTVDLYGVCSAMWVSAWASVRQDIANNNIECTIRSATQTVNDMLWHCGLCGLNQWYLLTWKSCFLKLSSVTMAEEWCMVHLYIIKPPIQIHNCNCDDETYNCNVMWYFRGYYCSIMALLKTLPMHLMKAKVYQCCCCIFWQCFTKPTK